MNAKLAMITSGSATRGVSIAVVGAAAVALISARPARAQGADSQADALSGAWRGTSLCTAAGRPTCHDETVVYHFRALPSTPEAAGQRPSTSREQRIEWTANKIVNGQEEEMGVLLCFLSADSHTVSCPMRDWMWTLNLRGDAIDGTLVNGAQVVWRNIKVARAAAPGVRQQAAKP